MTTTVFYETDLFRVTKVYLRFSTVFEASPSTRIVSQKPQRRQRLVDGGV